MDRDLVRSRVGHPWLRAFIVAVALLVSASSLIADPDSTAVDSLASGLDEAAVQQPAVADTATLESPTTPDPATSDDDSSEIPDWLWPSLIAAFVTAAFAWHQARRQRRLHDLETHKSSGQISFVRVGDFEPERCVAHYNEQYGYLAIARDDEIGDALSHQGHVLLVGRPGIGKSHAAVVHIKWTCPDHLLVIPSPAGISDPYNLNIKPARKKRCVLFLDDLSDYAKRADGDTGIVDLIERLSQACAELKVVATNRCTIPEYSDLNDAFRIYKMFSVIQLDDWSRDQCRELAQLVGGLERKWDGTPLSIKVDPAEMATRYQQADVAARSLLQGLNLLNELGICQCNETMLRSVFVSDIFKQQAEQFLEALKWLRDAGFVDTTANEAIAVYDAYLGLIGDWKIEDRYRDIVLDVLKQGKHLDDLLAMADALCGWTGRHTKAELADQFEFDEEEGFSTDLEQALGLYRACTDIRSDDPRPHKRLGLINEVAGRPEAAVDHFRMAAENDRGNVSAWYRLADAYRNLNKGALAQNAVNKAIEAARRHNPVSLCFRASRLRADGQPEEALAMLEHVLELDPRMAAAHIEKGRALLALKMYDEAKASYLRALEIEEAARAYFGIGIVYRKLRDLPAAENAFRSATNLEPGNALFHSYLATVLGDCGKFPAAIKEYREAIELSHDYVYAWVGFSRALMKNADLDRAESAIQTALKLRPNSATVHYQWGCVLKKFPDRPDEAEAALDTAIRLNPRVARYYCEIMSLLSRRQAWEEVDRYYDKAIELDGDYAMAHCQKGRSHETRGPLDVAEAFYDKALAADPDLREAKYGKVMVMIKAERMEPALEYCKQWVVDDHAHYQAYQALGRVHYLSREFELATQAFAAAVERDPNYYPAYYWHYRSYSRAQSLDQALEFLNGLSEKHRVSGPWHWSVANIHSKQGNKDEARSHYQTAIDSQAPRWQFFANFGRFLLDEHEVQEGRDMFFRAVELNRRIAYSWMGLAEAEMGLGVREKACGRDASDLFEAAESFYDKVIEINPDLKEARYGKVMAKLRLERFKKALDYCQQWIADDPADYLAHQAHGRAHFASGDDWSAMRAFASSVELAPSYHPAYYWHYRTYRRTRSLGQAFTFLQGLSKKHQKSGSWNWSIAYIHRKQGRKDLARTHFRAATEAKAKNAQFFVSFGRFLVEESEYAEGRKMYLEAVEINPLHSFGWLGLAEAELGLGKREEARRCAQRANEITPDRDDILGLLARLK
ncbi:MAG: tetratricopeptide repeat protein [bacterium]|nr:tetratricopeptide repeat protein [bacterium]